MQANDELPETVRVTIKAGETFLGKMHFLPTDYTLSSEWADLLITEGVASKSDRVGSRVQ